MSEFPFAVETGDHLIAVVVAVIAATPSVLTGLTVEELGILILALGRMLTGGAEPASEEDAAALYAALSREFHRRFDR